MRSYERGGVTVDQCGDCRGIFLDRGELERLIDAESSHYSRAALPVPDRDLPERGLRGGDRPRSDERPRYDDRHDDRYKDDRYRGDDHDRKKRRRSFLEELFD